MPSSKSAGICLKNNPGCGAGYFLGPNAAVSSHISTTRFVWAREQKESRRLPGTLRNEAEGAPQTPPAPDKEPDKEPES